VAKEGRSSFSTAGLKLQGDDFKMSDILRITENKEKIRLQVADALPRLEGRKKIVWMCASIEHAENVAKEIGSTASIIHSKNPNNEYAIECFERGDVRHMVNVMMLHEGYDYPAIDAIVLMRPTRSPTLYVQCVGRGLRPAPGKSDCLVLDYGEVVRNCGPVHDPITRARRIKAEKEKMIITVRVCPKCLSYVQPGEEVCPDCGHEMKVPRDPTKNLTVRAGEIDLLKERGPERLECVSVVIGKYKTKKGDPNIRISFSVKGRMWPVHMYISKHPWAWNNGYSILKQMTPFTFNDWQECYDNCEALVLETPEFIITKMEGGFEKVTGILSRTQDSDIPF